MYSIRRGTRRAALLAALTAASVLATPSRAHAQAQQVQVSVSYVPIVRLDLIGGDPVALQAGAGLELPLSNYFSLGGTVGAGISKTGFSGRGDLYGRFSLDPYHQNPWEPYLGAGATLRLDSGGPGTREYLLGIVGVNGPRTGSVVPGVELGFGGGVRLGVMLRFAGPAHR